MSEYFNWKIVVLMIVVFLGLIIHDIYKHNKEIEYKLEKEKNNINIVIENNKDSLKNLIIKRDEEIKEVKNLSDSDAVELFKQLVSE